MRKALCFLILIMGITSLASGQGSESRLKVITWNILNGFDFGNDTVRRSQYQNWIAHQQPDVVALEELCGYTPGKLQEDATSWGHPYSLLLKTTGYSVGLTSRYPIELKEKIIEGMHHGALHAKIHGIDYLAVHLHPGSIRRRQEETRILLSRLEAVKTENSKYIVLGDFNAHSPGDEDGYDPNGFLLTRYRASDGDKGPDGNIINGHLDYSVMSSFLGFSLMDVVQSHTGSFKERGSFPGKILIPEYYKSDVEIRAASQRIDYILVSPELEPYCVRAHVANEEENGKMSDHFPVVAVFDWSGRQHD